MTPDETVTAFIQALERMDMDGAMKMLAEDVTYDNVPIGAMQGRDAVRKTLDGMMGATEVDWPVARQAATGNVVMNERVDRFKLETGWLEIPVVGVFEVGDDGLISPWRDYFDLETFKNNRKALG